MRGGRHGPPFRGQSPRGGRTQAAGGPELDEVAGSQVGAAHRGAGELRPLGSQHRPVAGPEPDQDLGPFPGREQQPIQFDRIAEQPAVGADQGERASVGEAQIEEAAAAAVEQPQPEQRGGHLDMGSADAVGQQRAADRAQRIVALDPHDPAGGVEETVLQDEREVVDAVLARQAGAQAGVVVHDEQAGEPVEHLRLGLPMRVRVVPQGRRRLPELPLGGAGPARRDRRVRAAVHGRGQVHAVPVQRGGLGQVVADFHPDEFALPRPQSRAEGGAVVAHRRRDHLRPAGDQAALAGARREQEAAPVAGEP